MENPAAMKANGASENVVLAGVDASEPTASPRTLQADYLCQRFGLMPAIADVIAELAFRAELPR